MVLSNAQWMANAGADAYSVDNSVVFDDGTSQNFGRLPVTASNRKKGIISCWVKRANLADGQVWGAFRSSGGNNFLGLGFSSNAIAVQAQNASSTVLALTTSAVFRDPHAWYHIVFVYDTTPSTPGASDIKIYVNGEVAALSGSPTYPSQNVEFEWGNTAAGDNNFNFTIGDRGDDNFFDGYIAEFVYQDGQSFSAITDYGETDSNGVWRPVNVSGLTFGTNGFYIPFTDSSFLGLDNSATTNSPGAVPALLMHFDGSDASTTMTDSSPYSHSCTAQDNAQIDTAQYKFGGAALLLDGTNDRVSVADDSSLDIGSNNFTLAGWVRFNGSPSGDATFIAKWRLASGQREFRFYYENSSSELKMQLSTTGSNEVTVSESWSPSGDTWYHVAASRTGGKIHLFVDGTQLGSGTSNSSTVNNAGHAVTFGCADNAGPVAALNGWLDEWIFLNGTGIYSSNFTPPTSAYAINNSFVGTNSPTQSGDSPTKNFCVLTPLEVGNGTATFSNGNLKVVQSSGGNLNTFGSIGLSSGKWHYEVTLTNTVDQFGLGIIPVGNIRDGNTNQFFNNGIGAMVSGSSDGNVYNNGSHVATITGGSGTDGQTLSCEIDLDNDQLEWFNNAGSSLGTYSFTQATANSGRYLPCVHCNDDATYVANFGASTFSKTPSTNFTGISAALLKEQVTPAIEDGTAHQQTVTYSGDNGTRTVAQSGNSTFTADWVWIKDRDFGNSHALWDRVRGSNNFLKSDSNAAQATEANVKTSGDGFSDSSGLNFTGAGASFDINASGRTYVAWQWKGDGTSGETNDDGSIDSTVNVHDTAGFVIGKYTTPAATAAVRTVGHGLGGALDMLFIKNQASGHWVVWHNGIGDKYLRLNSPDKAEAGGTMWNSVLPSANATTFTIGTNSDVNGNEVTFTFYGFRAIAGYSAFGSYEGNGNSDGPVISLGFKPAFTLIKNMDVSADSWIIQDNAREPNNAVGKYLQPNLTATEGDSAAMSLDYLSNGFKVRGTEHNINESGQTHVYMAFAEYPFAGTTPAPAR